MKSALNRILHYVRIHSGESDALARATHHGVQRNTHMNNVSVFCAQAALRIVRRTTIERIKMSTKTLRKRIALTSVVALAAGLLSVAPASATNTDYAFDLVPSGSYNQVAYTESSGVEYSTFTMTAGPTEKITLTAEDTDGYDYMSVVITGGTGTFTAASRGYKTGTVQDSNGGTAGGIYCSFSNIGTAAGSSATAGVFGSTILWEDIDVPAGYEFDTGDWDLGELCGEWNSGTEADATVTIPATAAGSMSITVSQYDSLSDIDVEQRLTVNVLPAASSETASTRTWFTSGQHQDNYIGYDTGYGVKDGAGVIYSPAKAGYLVGRFAAEQQTSSGATVDDNKALAMDFSITGPGCIRSWEIGSNDCGTGVSISRLAYGAGEDSTLNVRLDSDGTPGTTTITASTGGKVVKTWTVKFFGQAKTISFVAAQTIGEAGGGVTGDINSDYSIANNDADCGDYICIYSANADNDVAYGVVVKDALGTPIPTDEDYLGQFGNLVVTSSNYAVISDPDDDCFIEDGAGLYSVATFAEHCEFESADTAVSGQTANIVWTIFNNDGTTVTASQPVTIGGEAKTVTVAFDKTSYVIGTKASVVLTAKDAAGNPAYDGASVLTPAGLASNLSSSASGALATTTTVVGGKATVKTFAPVVPGTWTVSGTDLNGVAVSATATITNANDARLASLITKINALSKLIKKIQKKIGVK